MSILSVLRGQSILLPDLNVTFDGWPREVNQGLDQLRHDVDEWLDRYDIKNCPLIVSFSVTWMALTFDCISVMGHSPKLEALKAVDYGHFGASWWPRASYERLRVATFFAAWVGICSATFRISAEKDCVF